MTNLSDAKQNRLSLPGTAQTAGQIAKQIAILFKLRVVSLLILAAIGGAFLGARGFPTSEALASTVLMGFMAAGGASAINQYLERSSDKLMRRTQSRPLANGQLERPVVIAVVGGVLVLLSVLITLSFNAPMAFYLGLGALIYVGVYTIWLKPRSVLNIIIGGAAGSCAVMTGGAAAGSAADFGVVVLALLVFLWTPVHFWALAIFYREDYSLAGIPMLPVLATPRQSAIWILFHALGTVLGACMLAVHPSLGWPYLIPVAVASIILLNDCVLLLNNPGKRQAIKLFIKSNLFLAVILVTIILITALKQLVPHW